MDIRRLRESVVAGVGRRPRARTVALVGLLVTLAAAGLVTRSRSLPPTAPGPAGTSQVAGASEVAGSIPTASTRAPAGAGALARLLGGVCRPEPGWAGWVRCRVAGVAVVARATAPGDAAALYASLAGRPGPPRGGPADCAVGRPDERSWSRPSAPRRPVGRYRCRLEGGRAVLWWSDADVVARATAPHSDLGRLFSWWTRHAGA